MSQRHIVVFASMVMAVVIVVITQAAEKKITRAQLPPAVEKTVAEQAQGASIQGFTTAVEDGTRLYEVELLIDGHGRDISIDTQGHVVEVEEEVALASLPSAVQQGLAKAAGTGTISKVESLTKKGTLVAYEAVVQRGKKHTEMQVGPNGQKLAHEE